MIITKLAKDLVPGDTFSTDGYRVRSVNRVWNGGPERVSVTLWFDGSGGISKSAVLDLDHECPIYVYADANGHPIKVGDTVTYADVHGEAHGKVLLLENCGNVYVDGIGYWGDCKSVSPSHLFVS